MNKYTFYFIKYIDIYSVVIHYTMFNKKKYALLINNYTKIRRGILKVP